MSKDTSDVKFRAYPQFNQPELAKIAHLRHRVNKLCLPYFDRKSGPDRLARAFVACRAIDVKELLESSEFYVRTRKRLRSKHMVDLCCGHGLTGLLFATEHCVETVTLVDRKRPDSFSVILEVFAELYPYVIPKIRYLEEDIDVVGEQLAPGSSILGLHACGGFTDRCIDIGLSLNAHSLALMPCCYQQATTRAPRVLRDVLGAEVAKDVHRTYRMEEAGYIVDWTGIPRAITPKNRILLATQRLT